MTESLVPFTETAALPDSDLVLDAMIARDIGETDGVFAQFRAWLVQLATPAGVAGLQRDPGQLCLVARIVAVHRRVRAVPRDLLAALESERDALDADRESALEVLGRWHDALLTERTRGVRVPHPGGTLRIAC
jgi:hypothetical protein